GGDDGRAPDRGLAAAYQPSRAHRGAAPAGARADGDRLRVPAGPQRALHLFLAADRSVRGDVRTGADTPRRLRPPGRRAVAAPRGDSPGGGPASAGAAADGRAVLARHDSRLDSTP